MSGGSHDYLCYTDFPETMGKTEGMEEMETELIRLGYHCLVAIFKEMI